MKKHVLKIEFDNKSALNHFVDWLDGSGEQDYWNWMECKEPELDPIVATFIYKHKKENIILAPCKKSSSIFIMQI
jgi:hypothetical protein